MASILKTISPSSIFLLIILSISTQTHLSSSFALNSTDIHELFPLYGFPKGLLPNNVKSYTVFSGDGDGSFEIELETDCYVEFDPLVYFGKKIKGKLRYGSVTGVSGIQAKKLFLWVSVTGIKAHRDSGTIDFYVGVLSETLSVEQFRKIPACKGNDWLGERTEAVSN